MGKRNSEKENRFSLDWKENSHLFYLTKFRKHKNNYNKIIAQYYNFMSK